MVLHRLKSLCLFCVFLVGPGVRELDLFHNMHCSPLPSPSLSLSQLVYGDWLARSRQVRKGDTDECVIKKLKSFKAEGKMGKDNLLGGSVIPTPLRRTFSLTDQIRVDQVFRGTSLVFFVFFYLANF